MRGRFVNHFQFRGRSITRLSLVPAPRYTDAMSDTATLETESEIVEQVIQSDTAGLSPEAARAVRTRAVAFSTRASRPDQTSMVSSPAGNRRTEPQPIRAGPQTTPEMSGGLRPVASGDPDVVVRAIVEAALTQPGIGLVQDRLGSDLVHPVHRVRRQSPETEGLPKP